MYITQQRISFIFVLLNRMSIKFPTPNLSKKKFIVFTFLSFIIAFLSVFYFWYSSKDTSKYLAKIEFVLQKNLIFSSNPTPLSQGMTISFTHFLNSNKDWSKNRNYSSFEQKDGRIQVELNIEDNNRDKFYSNTLPELNIFVREQLDNFNESQKKIHKDFLVGKDFKLDQDKPQFFNLDLLSNYNYFENVYIFKVQFRKTGLLFLEYFSMVMIVLVSLLATLTTIFLAQQNKKKK